MTNPFEPTRRPAARAAARPPVRTPGPVPGVLLAALLAAHIASTPALHAQEPADSARALPADTVIPLDAVVVTTARQVVSAGGTSAVVVQPDSLRVRPAPTLDEILRELPFVGVRGNSRGEAEITMRGSESRQVAVLVDGVPLTLGWDHRTDPSLIPVTGVERITLVRGLHSVLYGPNVLGGVVEMRIAGAPGLREQRPRAQIRTGVDHLGGRSLGAVGSRPVALDGGALLLRGGVGYRERPGIALPGGVLDPGGDDGLRANSDTEHYDAFAALRYQADGGAWLALSGSGYTAERGVPPELHVSEPRLWRYPESRRLLAAASGGTGHRATPWGRGDLEASVGVDLGRTEILSYRTLAYQELDGTEAGDDRTVTLRLLGDHTLGSGMLRGALTYADVNHDELLDGTDAFSYRQRLWSAAAEATLPVVPGAELSGGLVLDGAATPESGDKPPLGTLTEWGGRLGASAAAGERVRVHAALNRRARFPSLRELYSGALGRFEPNPALRPETLLGAELGATGGWTGVELQAVLFHHRLQDGIVRARTGDGRLRRENRDRVLSTGLELLGDWSRGGYRLLGDLMLQDVRVEDPAVPGSAGRPEHQPEWRAGLDAVAPLPLGLNGVVGAQYTGRQFCVHPDLDTEVALDGTGRVDLGADRTWTLARRGAGPFRTLRIGLFLDNALDSAVYDQCGLPQAGRTLRLALEVG